MQDGRKTYRSIPIRITSGQQFIPRSNFRSSNPDNLIIIDTKELPSRSNDNQSKQHQKKMHLTYLNVDSVVNKTTSVRDYIVSNEVDIMLLAETWFLSADEDNTVSKNELIPPGFKLKHTPRSDGRIGGGVGILFRDGIKITKKKANKSICSHTDQFEYLECVLSQTNDARSNVDIILVYRPPPTDVNKLKLSAFWKDWKKMLMVLASSNKEFLIFGDLNFHLDDLSHSSTKKFNAMLKQLDLVQLVTQPTHTAGHILDVVITKPENQIINGLVTVHDPGISSNAGTVTKRYHYAIDVFLQYLKPKPSYHTVSYRNLKAIDHSSFIADLLKLNLTENLKNFPQDLDGMVDYFCSSLQTLIDCHAPALSRKVIQRPNSKWYTPELASEKRHRRKLERKWTKSGLECDRLEFRKQCATYSNMSHKTRVNKTKDKDMFFFDCT